MSTIESSPSLKAVLRPTSVAVIGASERPGTIGAAVFRNLLTNGFQGPVYPVKPGVRSVQGVRARPDVLPQGQGCVAVDCRVRLKGLE